MKYATFFLAVILIGGFTACTNDQPEAPEQNPSESASLIINMERDDIAQLADSQVEIGSVPEPTKETNTKQFDPKYEEIEWTALIPEDELALLLNPPEYIHEVEDGTLEDMISDELMADFDIDINDPYQRALVSTNVVPEMADKFIRLPGFVVPLAFGATENHITEFFFVPFFGACIHVPPPPPNQILYVNYPKGIRLTALYDAFWLMGKLKTELIENDTAISAYSLEMDAIVPYYE